MEPSLYAILGVPETADAAALKKAYRALARKHHPDVNPGDKGAEERFKQISGAWEVLGDAERRKLYDEFGDDASRSGFDPEQARAHREWDERSRWRSDARRAESTQQGEQFFESLFGDQRRSRGPRRGPDLHADLTTDFRTGAMGGVRSLRLGGGPPIDVRIPPAVRDGGRIRLRGKGAPGSGGGEAGDLVITLHIQPDPVFRREGLDLHLDLPITVVEAVRGAKVEVPTLDGRVVLTIPELAQSGQTLRLQGRGVGRKNQEPGHLYAHLRVVAPDSAVPEAVLDQLEQGYQNDVRASLIEVEA